MMLLNAMLVINRAMIDSAPLSTPERKSCAPIARTAPSAIAMTTLSAMEIVPIEIEYLRFKSSETMSMPPVLPPSRTMTPPANPMVTAPKNTLTTRQAGSLTSNGWGRCRFWKIASSTENSAVMRSE